MAIGGKIKECTGGRHAGINGGDKNKIEFHALSRVEKLKFRNTSELN